MSRVGKNPSKNNKKILSREYSKYCAVIVTYCPKKSGYWRQYQEIFSLSLYSMLRNTSIDLDVLVIDNGSCIEFKDFLYGLHKENVINFFYSIDDNLGKVGALNLVMPSINSDFIIFSDGDIFFYEKWLEAHIHIYNVFSALCDVGMVTGAPFPVPDAEKVIKYNSDCIADAKIVGCDMDDAIILQHLRDIGRKNKKYYEKYKKYKSFKILYNGCEAFIGARHLQFFMPCYIAREVFPVLKSGLAMNSMDVRNIDDAVCKLPALKLSSSRVYMRHIGNNLDPEWIGRYSSIQEGIIFGQNLNHADDFFGSIYKWIRRYL